ncbi:MAG: SDR family NAD(P)-dependent oxidoreductase [Ilumatobacter fluminis]|uniref:SDR family NAD(P)-dependent oxidoreductase n=1 Tax=Ilumatobacter fluminis TaxID=467091 RepID=UPI0032EC2AE5
MTDNNELRFDGAVAVITGAGRGLGAAHARLLAARGAMVVVNDVGGSLDGSAEEGASPAQELVAEITAAGGHAVADHHDVSTPESAAQVVQTAIDEFGRIDIVVNNAGILRDKTFHQLDPADMQKVLDVHLYGSAWVTRAAWPHLREQNGGRVVMTTSVAGYLGNFGQANYASAKAGLIGLTKTLAIEGGRRNIKVNAIAPGARTRMTEQVLGPLADRLDPSFVSPVVAMLAHESCPLNGELLLAAGGRVARVHSAQTRGWFDEAPTPESVLANVDTILDPTDAPVVEAVEQEFAVLTDWLGSTD